MAFSLVQGYAARMDNWKKLLGVELQARGESWGDIEATTLTEEQMAAPFDAESPRVEGVPFTVWTARRVYFPVEYDGQEWVGSVAREPDGVPTKHLPEDC